MIKENEAATNTVGKRLTQTPKKMFNLGAEFEKGGFSTSLVGRYVSKRYSKDDNSDVINNVYMSYDPYFVTDAKFSYNFKQMTASLSVDNIFDKEYFAYYKAPGRTISLEAKWKY